MSFMTPLKYFSSLLTPLFSVTSALSYITEYVECHNLCELHSGEKSCPLLQIIPHVHERVAQQACREAVPGILYY